MWMATYGSVHMRTLRRDLPSNALILKIKFLIDGWSLLPQNVLIPTSTVPRVQTVNALQCVRRSEIEFANANRH
jgi:hypothetical protein